MFSMNTCTNVIIFFYLIILYRRWQSDPPPWQIAHLFVWGSRSAVVSTKQCFGHFSLLQNAKWGGFYQCKISFHWWIIIWLIHVVMHVKYSGVGHYIILRRMKRHLVLTIGKLSWIWIEFTLLCCCVYYLYII